MQLKHNRIVQEHPDEMPLVAEDNACMLQVQLRGLHLNIDAWGRRIIFPAENGIFNLPDNFNRDEAVFVMGYSITTRNA